MVGTLLPSMAVLAPIQQIFQEGCRLLISLTTARAVVPACPPVKTIE